MTRNILENILLFFLYPDRWRAYGWNAGCAPMVAVVAERREELTWPDWGGYPREHAAGHQQGNRYRTRNYYQDNRIRHGIARLRSAGKLPGAQMSIPRVAG